MRFMKPLCLGAVLLLGGCFSDESPNSPKADNPANTDTGPTLAAILVAPQLRLEPRQGAVTARWEGVSEAAGYRLYWRDGYNGQTAVEMGGQLSYDHTGLQAGQTYYYQVAALDQEGAEHRSQEMGAIVPAALAQRGDAGP